MRLFVRHAKSSWDHPDLNDWERPLSARGERALEPLSGQIAQWVTDKPVTLFSSDAMRAKLTATALADALPQSELVFIPELYMASIHRWMLLLEQYPTQSAQIWIGHNPGMHQLIERLSNQLLDKFPTAAVAKFEPPMTPVIWTPKRGLQSLVNT